MSNLLSPTGEFPAFNPSARQVLPASAAVKGPRFSTSNHWAISSTAREVLDSFDLPLRPAARVDQNCESIICEGATIQRTLRTGSHVVRQTSTVAIEVDDSPPPLAFEVVADTTLQADAAAALEQINNRKPSARRTPRGPAPKAPRATRPDMVTVAIVLGGLVIAALVAVARGSL